MRRLWDWDLLPLLALVLVPAGVLLVEVAPVAALVCWLASEDCSFSTGAVFDASGGRATY